MFLPDLSRLERKLDENADVMRQLLEQIKELNKNVVRQNELLQNQSQK